jgi:hypothetical protein
MISMAGATGRNIATDFSGEIDGGCGGLGDGTIVQRDLPLFVKGIIFGALDRLPVRG